MRGEDSQPRDVSGVDGRRPGRFEVRCAGCGHAATVDVAPDACPMCRAATWTAVNNQAATHAADQIDTADPTLDPQGEQAEQDEQTAATSA
jgi:hypothetical protein